MIQNIGIKLLDQFAIVPTKTNYNDAGWDLYATNNTVIWPQQRAIIHTSISIQMPDNLAGLIWPRSGLSVKKGIDVLAGVIDAGYRGEIMVCLYNTDINAVEINRGDRIAQIIFQEVPNVNLNVLESLDSSHRGEQCFGSSGL